jgi:hypothetical protein
MVFITMTVLSVSAQAQQVVYDPVNALYNQIRNTLAELYHITDVTNALDQLLQLQKTFDELQRFHSGLDEIRSLFLGEYRRLGSFNLTSLGYQLTQTQQDFYSLVNGSSGVLDYRSYLNKIFGEDPQSATKPYITQEEVFAADGFKWASDVRKVIDTTIQAGQDISYSAQTASPKGAARLAADALGKILVTQGQIQQNQAKMIEIGAAQIEQVSREEKSYERERLKFMDEFNQLIEELTSR